MLNRPIRKMFVASLTMAAMLTMPAESRAGRIWDCLFGPTPASQTTYAPAYIAPPVVTMPYQPCAQSCQPVVSSCQSCQYVPQTTYTANYSAYYPPAPVYQVGYTPYVGYTTYRPLLPWNYPRLVPYTTYRPVYSPVLYYQSYSPCSGCSPCNSCNSCGGNYGTTTSGCSSCGETASNTPASYYGESSDTTVTGNGSPTEAAPKTYKDTVEKPATPPDPKPTAQPETQMNSMPTPSLPDPNNNRTASMPTLRQSSGVKTASYVAPKTAPRPRTNDDWQPSKD
jgi:hypothetical protein